MSSILILTRYIWLRFYANWKAKCPFVDPRFRQDTSQGSLSNNDDEGLRKRHSKCEFALLQTFSLLFHVV